MIINKLRGILLHILTTLSFNYPYTLYTDNVNIRLEINVF